MLADAKVPKVKKIVIVFDNGRAFDIDAKVNNAEDESTFYPDCCSAEAQNKAVDYKLTVRFYNAELR